MYPRLLVDLNKLKSNLDAVAKITKEQGGCSLMIVTKGLCADPEMAKMVANEIANGEINVVFDIPEDAKTYGYAPDVKMKLSSQKMQALGWRPEIGLKDSYLRMMQSMKNTM